MKITLLHKFFWAVFHSSQRPSQIGPTADFDGTAIPISNPYIFQGLKWSAKIEVGGNQGPPTHPGYIGSEQRSRNVLVVIITKMIDRVTTFEELFKLLYLFRRVICYVKIEVMTVTMSMAQLT